MQTELIIIKLEEVKKLSNLNSSCINRLKRRKGLYCNPQITQRPGNRINPRRMSALKLATFFGGGLFGF